MTNSVFSVTTHSGDVAGRLNIDSGVATFFGIPYAKPPIGKGRFAPPVPVGAWSGTLDASDFRPSSAHLYDGEEGTVDDFGGWAEDGENLYVGDEDSLTLNTWCTPSSKSTRPVIVFIHGGANWVGTSRLPVYHGDRFVANNDVVFVSINYRLGTLGFLELGEFGGPDFVGSSNNSLKDQLTAVHWVHDNIAAFGGDPQNITLLGQSAGSANISWLLAGGHLNGLVRRVVLMSGIGGNKVRHDYSIGGGDAVASRFLQLADIDCIEEFQRMSTRQLMQCHQKAFDRMHVFEKSMFSPRIDGDFLTDSPIGCASKGMIQDIDVLLGYTSYEMGLWLLYDPELDRRDYQSQLRHSSINEDQIRELASLYDAIYADERIGVRAMNLLSDIWFVMPSLLFAEHLVKNGNNAWVYEFSWSQPNSPAGAAHAFDLFFAFDKTDEGQARRLLGEPLSDHARQQRHRLSRQMQDSLVSFARCGDPNCDTDGLPDWSPYSLPERPVLNFDTANSIRSDPQKEAREWWMKNEHLLWSEKDVFVR